MQQPGCLEARIPLGDSLEAHCKARLGFWETRRYISKESFVRVASVGK